MRVEFHVSRTSFGDALGAMREWLDREQCPDVRFETAAAGDLVLITVEFPSTDLAGRFRHEFVPQRAAA